GAGVAPVTPAAGALFAQPARARRTSDASDPDAFPELSGEVSAVVGSPSAGAPRSAVGAVSAQHRRSESGERERPEIDGQDRVDPPVRRTGAAPAAGPVADDDPFADDVLDQTVIARRSVRPVWELVPASGSPVPLSASVVILGRRPSSDPAYPAAQLVAVPGDARTVSKTHARIELRGDAWTVTDLGSTNGVLVRTLMGDEVEVEAGGQLDAGERFFLGDEEFHLRRIAH
uniref:FHA domain-containing protein n=1 Tax=uncultured Microbacterium sp. TaxID=191216 RepID=UPI0028E1E2CE